MTIAVVLLIIGILGIVFKPEVMWRYKDYKKYKLQLWYNFGKRRHVTLYTLKPKSNGRSS